MIRLARTNHEFHYRNPNAFDDGMLPPTLLRLVDAITTRVVLIFLNLKNSTSETHLAPRVFN